MKYNWELEDQFQLGPSAELRNDAAQDYIIYFQVLIMQQIRLYEIFGSSFLPDHH
jgi:hypothetical protein